MENTIGYWGMDISQRAQILRDKQTKAASLETKLDGPWRLFAGRTDLTIDLSKPVLEGRGAGSFPLAVDPAVRWYFQLNTPQGGAVLAERHLPMSGGYNFRDLGGLATRDGRHVRWGKLLRSDELNGLTDVDLAYLASVPVMGLADFRSEEERKRLPDRIPASVKHVYELTIDPGNLMAMMGTPGAEHFRFDEAMLKVYRLLVSEPEYVGVYRAFFAHVQQPADRPLLFHCSAGKDRTGLAAAFILLALGVDVTTVMAGYLASNDYLAGKYASELAAHPEMSTVFYVRSGLLQEALDTIRTQYGSVEAFLAGPLGIDIPRLRQSLLYSPQED